MLDIFRENARSWLIQTVIAALSLVFIMEFGPGSRGCRGGAEAPTWTAKVNGVTVPIMSFVNAYRQRAAMLEQYGIKEEDFEKFGVRKSVMDGLVDEELLAQQAQKNGLYVSDDELAKAVEKEFTHDGAFDADEYRDYLKRDKGFEARFRRAVLSERMRGLAQDVITVSDDEIMASFLKQGEAASINYVQFRPDQFANKLQLSDAEIDKVLKEREDDIRKQYDSNSLLYMDPHAIKANRILIVVKPNATPAEEAAAKKKIDDAVAQLKGGKSWDEVAGPLKADAQGQDTDLGWVAQGQSTLDRMTEDNIFRLKPGEHSEAIRVPFGYEIVHALADRPAVQKKFDAVKRDIAREFARQAKLSQMAKDAATETLAKLKAGTSLDAQWPAGKATDTKKIELSGNPEAKSTDSFHPGDLIPGVGWAPDVTEAAFSLTADKRTPDAPIEDHGAFWVIQLKSRTRADVSKLTPAKKEEIWTQLIEDKRSDMLQTWLKELKKNATIEKNQELLSYAPRPAPEG